MFGVHSAMPISKAYRLCPHGVYLPVDMDKYARVSSEIMVILADFSPLVEPVSVDEAFVDLTGTETLWGPPPEAVRRIKARIRSETGLTASAGLAANKFIAKVASELEKPDGLVVVPPGREPEFLAPLPIERLWGVGKATAKELQALGIATIGQLQRVTPRALAARLGPHGPDLLELAFGRDARPVEPFSLPKSMGAETTFGRDCRDVARIEETLRAQSERVARELRAEGLAACRVTLKLRWADFRTLTRSRSELARRAYGHPILVSDNDPVNDEKSRVVANWIMDVPFAAGFQFSGLITLGTGPRQDISGRFDPKNFKPGAITLPQYSFPLVPGAWAYRNVDLRLRKDFPQFSRGTIGVTADLFNALNYQNFGCMNGGTTPTCVVSDPRRLQIGAEYTF